MNVVEMLDLYVSWFAIVTDQDLSGASLFSLMFLFGPNCLNCGMPSFSTTFFNSTIPELSNTYSELEISNDSDNESTDNIGLTTYTSSPIQKNHTYRFLLPSATFVAGSIGGFGWTRVWLRRI
jgi:hypothetical protein